MTRRGKRSPRARHMRHTGNLTPCPTNLFPALVAGVFGFLAGKAGLSTLEAAQVGVQFAGVFLDPQKRAQDLADSHAVDNFDFISGLS